MNDIDIDEKAVDEYFMKNTEPFIIYNSRSAHSMTNESNDSIQLSVPILTNYFENWTQVGGKTCAATTEYVCKH